MKKIIMTVLICTMALCLFACKKKEETVEYNDEEGVAEGSVELAGDEPKINISNIKAQVGADIDYLSGVVVEDEEKFEDLKVWVDASAVDIYEPGDYKAKYTFEYDGKSVEHYITVTIVEGPEESAGDGDQVADAGNAGNSAGDGNNNVVNNNVGNNNVGNNNAGNNNAGNANNSPETQTQAMSDNQNNQQDNANQQTTTKNNGNASQQTTTKKQTTTTANQATTTKKPATTTASQATTTKKPATTTANNTSSETTRRQMITSSGNTTTEVKQIGYSYIDLLSGSTVSIKSTTQKYVLLTRTDVSYITKNGVEYKVSKLVIRYNTGEERTLETVEEKCN